MVSTHLTPKISVIIPTHNRPELLKKAVRSVMGQIYQDFEVVVVDDGDMSSEDIIKSFSDPRIKYIKHKISHSGGSAARNTGIKNSTGEFIAFLDDDDEWKPEKLEIQMREFENTSDDVGFCFSATKTIKDKGEFITQVPEGVNDYFELVLDYWKMFLTATLIIKKEVFNKVGLFDEEFPSHQESELMVRVAEKYKGLGVNKPLVIFNMKTDHEHIGSDFQKRINGREMILKKHIEKFKRYPKFLANHYFGLGLLYRDNNQYDKASEAFWRAIRTNLNPRYFAHYISMFGGGFLYKAMRSIK